MSKKKKFYREYMVQCGWGVMIGYDTVEASDFEEAKQSKPSGMYGKDFEKIIVVDPKHCGLSDEELSKIYD